VTVSARAVRRRDRRRWWTTFTLLGLFGLVWVALTPMIGQPDEAAHAQRAAAVASGQWTGPTERTDPRERTLEIRTVTRVTVPEAFAALDGLVPWFVFPPPRPAVEAPALPDGREPAEARTYVGTYPPLPYLLIGLPARVLPPREALYGMRLASVVLCAALYASALVAARRADPSGVTVVGTAAAMTPVALWLAAGIGSSGLEIAAAVLTWTAGLDLFGGERRDAVDRRAVARLALGAGILMLTRPLGPVFVVIALSAVLAATWDRDRLRLLAGDASVRVAAGALVAAAGVAVAWVLRKDPLASIQGRPVFGLGLADALREALGLVPTRTGQMVGVIGWLDTPIPTPVTVAWVTVVLVLLALAIAVAPQRRPRVTLAILLVAVVGVPVVAEAARAAEYGFGWQGRYTLPMAAGVPIVSGWVIGTSAIGPRLLTPRVRAVVVVGFAAAQLVTVLTGMTRWSTGARWPPSVPLDGLPWTPAVPGGLLLAAAIVVLVDLAAWLAALATFDPRAGAAQPPWRR
jgi:hypothetical protein